VVYNYSPLFIYIGLLSILLISHIILNQIDLKLIIAYSSIIHTNYMLIGLFTINKIGIYSSLISGIAHGFISSGLFLSVGILYNRYKTRIIIYYKGLSELMVLFSIT
jgi:NADH-ubiquinone oxidoreductase chain 4